MIHNAGIDPSGGRAPSIYEQKLIELIKHDFACQKRDLEKNLAPGRARSIAITHLETACMWATRAVFDPRPERTIVPQEVPE